ncbi:hypothetical protein [Streptomyces lycii]|uniref:Uncharacterized protein n=2 Tax=Streptomyces TaxID=1883 RepID=A0ABQ7FD23_9ACTN|nr:hypothetical protein [Streptomyces lycii]KAF4406901.1 hypothetical protein GCU69_22380 [Streptomyces lycii]
MNTPHATPAPEPGAARDPGPGVPPAPGPGAPPPTGTAVRDTARDRVGVVMDHEGQYLQLRPLLGGREWDADPAAVRPLTPEELLSARVAEVNARSRQAP